MRDEEQIFQTNSDRCSYRVLQQTAKRMGLPSNVKKVYLIQLINTKNYGTLSDLNLLVQHIRGERKKILKKKNEKFQQSPEISSRSNTYSMESLKTPKQVNHFFIHYNSEMTCPIKYSQTLSSRRVHVTSSDRVLRSSNQLTKPSYLLNNTLMSLRKGSHSDEQKEPRVKIVSTEEPMRRVCCNFAKPIIESGQIENIFPPVLKQPRKLIGVNPLQPEDIKRPSVLVRHPCGSISKIKAIIQRPLLQPNYSDRQTQTDNVSDNRQGSFLKKANATPSAKSETAATCFRSSNICEMDPSLNFSVSELSPSFTSRPSTIQNVGLRTLEVSEPTSDETEVSPTNSNKATNSSMQVTQDNFSSSSSCDETTLSNITKEINNSGGEYYHKNIQAEQVRSLRRSREMARSVDNEAGEAGLPNVLFSKFNSVYSGDVTQPLFEQVDNEPEIYPIPQYIQDPRGQYQGSSTLEMIYNLRMQHQPTPQTSTTTNTRTVYCTRVISTAMAQPFSTAVHNLFNVASPPHESQPSFMNEHAVPRANDFFSNFHDREHSNKGSPTLDFQRVCPSVETLTSQEQELGTNITIPEMVEDALEIISQDGDDMEPMGTELRMQCILCNWAGPKIILENHIRKDHSSEIVQCESNEFSASYPLGDLSSRRLWLSHALQYDDAVYVLSAKYEDPDHFMAALSTVSYYDPDNPRTGSMTIYNKVTGEPFTWTGVVTDLPPCMPYENDPNCFKLQLSQMNLLPKSANLKFWNRELVILSPTKMVVGQPELDSLIISLHVKIFN